MQNFFTFIRNIFIKYNFRFIGTVRIWKPKATDSRTENTAKTNDYDAP